MGRVGFQTGCGRYSIPGGDGDENWNWSGALEAGSSLKVTSRATLPLGGWMDEYAAPAYHSPTAAFVFGRHPPLFVDKTLFVGRRVVWLSSRLLVRATRISAINLNQNRNIQSCTVLVKNTKCYGFESARVLPLWTKLIGDE